MNEGIEMQKPQENSAPRVDKGEFPDCGCHYTTEDDGIHFCDMHKTAPQVIADLLRVAADLRVRNGELKEQLEKRFREVQDLKDCWEGSKLRADGYRVEINRLGEKLAMMRDVNLSQLDYDNALSTEKILLKECNNDLAAETVRADIAEEKLAALEAQTKWRPIADLDRSKMQFVLVLQDGAIRTMLWNPRGYWEYAPPHFGPADPHCDGGNPTHWQPLPEPPQPSSSVTGGVPTQALGAPSPDKTGGGVSGLTFWCAACGTWGDHQSGTCPTI